MFRTFNMGIGMVVILDKNSAQNAKAIGAYSQSFELGTVVSGHKVVEIL